MSCPLPPPSFGAVSPYRKKLKRLKPGQFVTVSSEGEQRACYACGVRLGLNVSRRTVDGKLRVYLRPEESQAA